MSWARNLVFSLYDNEDFLLQIDSHTAFNNDYDSELIRQHESLLNLSKKPIITCYPHAFTYDGDNTKLPSRPNDTVSVLRPAPNSQISKNNVKICFRGKNTLTTKPMLGCHIAGGFYFCKGIFIEEVPIDPFLYFHGEEQSLSIRAYTRGWDIFHLAYIPVYHQYKKANTYYNEHHWSNSVPPNRFFTTAALSIRSDKRLIRLLCTDETTGMTYGLGIVRTRNDFIHLSGINYNTFEITDPYDNEYR